MFDIGATGLGLIDYAIFFAALVAVLVVGIISGGKIKDLEDYALSKRKKFSTPVLAMTLIVTIIGSNSSMGRIAEVYNNGLIYIFSILLWMIGSIILVQHAANFMIGRYAGKISLYGLMEKEYGEMAARIASIISVFISMVYLSMQILGMGYVTKTFLNIPFIWGASLSAFVFIVYSSLCGIRGVVYTDILQFFIILIVFPILVGIVVYKVGGIEMVFLNYQRKNYRCLTTPISKNTCT
jgi:SSS family solute:Na+ symporter